MNNHSNPHVGVLGALLTVVLVSARCVPDRDHDAEQRRRVVLRVHTDQPSAMNQIRFEPASGVRAARLGADWLAVDRADARNPLTIHIPGMCPVALPALADTRQSHADSVAVKPLIDLGADRAQVGFDTEFEISVTRGCEIAERGRVSWRQLSGPPLADLTITAQGWSLRARTLPLDRLQTLPLPHGLVPVAPRTQGRYVLEATWQGANAAPVRRSVSVTSIARATGVPSLAVSQQVLLGGSGWHVTKAPHGGGAQVRDAGDYALFTPDAAGRWALADGDERPITLQALWHDRTPFDCGRRECHAAISDATTSTAMSHALERQFTLGGRTPETVSCMLDCHVTGERGIHDGGFLDVASELGFHWFGRPSWDELPQPLRRLGGVRCTACHGPGAIPEPAARATILRSDVCATCHDSPPNYVHVSEWRRSRMARADVSPATRSGPACARCHTSSGFLDALGVRKVREPDLDAAPAGITCAACHAPHTAHRGNRLLRLPAAPESLANPDDTALDPRSLLCASCHAPESQGMPAASSAAIWAGRVRLPRNIATAGGDIVAGSTTHRDVPGGCTGCHGRRPEQSNTPALDHSFRVDRATCTQCHGSVPPEERPLHGQNVQQRARELMTELRRRCGGPASNIPPHAASAELTNCKTDNVARALYQVLLVAEDPAAGVHNAPFARMLLDAAAAQLN